MQIESLLRSTLWRDFSGYARRQRRDPVELLAEMIESRLTDEGIAALDAEMSRQAQHGGLRANDAVRIVREHRSAKRRDAAS